MDTVQKRRKKVKVWCFQNGHCSERKKKKLKYDVFEMDIVQKGKNKLK